MLSEIKNMINQKNAYLEASSAIFEDAQGVSLDDVIVLGEDTEDPTIGEAGDEDTNENEPAVGSDEPMDDVVSEPVDNEDSMDDGAIGSDDLPTPIGAQTGEPVADNIDDLLTAEIDLKSNTLRDVLPVPPANAGEAIASDDILNQHIDSGFGGEDEGAATEEADDILDSPIDSGQESVDDDMLSEAISLSDDPAPDNNGGGEATDASGDPAPDDGAVVDPGPEGENEVTAAVRDKVAEADTGLGDDGGSTSTGGVGSTDDDLFKKITSLGKNIDDIKQALFNRRQQ